MGTSLEGTELLLEPCVEVHCFSDVVDEVIVAEEVVKKPAWAVAEEPAWQVEEQRHLLNPSAWNVDSCLLSSAQWDAGQGQPYAPCLH